VIAAAVPPMPSTLKVPSAEAGLLEPRRVIAAVAAPARSWCRAPSAEAFLLELGA
jgi:hypothetical protein